MAESEVTAILDLANTRHGPGANLEERLLADGEHDHLADPAAALAYLGPRRPDLPSEAPTVVQLERLRDLRDAARAMPDLSPAQRQATLDRLRVGYTYRLALDGSLEPTGSGWDALGGLAFAGLFDLLAEPGRLRTCANPACAWLFVDGSRNHSRVWCDMGTCGSRAKMSRYRRRHATVPPP